MNLTVEVYLLVVLLITLCKSSDAILTAPRLQQTIQLSKSINLHETECATNDDCNDASICSRHYGVCMEGNLGQDVVEYGPNKGLQTYSDLLNFDIENVTQVVEFGRIISDYTRAAFCDEKGLLTWNCTVCATDFTKTFRTVAVASSSKWDTQGYIGYDPTYKLIIISFRGTNGPQDSFLDTVIWPSHPKNLEECVGCSVDYGFNFAYETMSDVLLDAMETIQKMLGDNNGYRIMTTGHSLGGAIATVSAVDMFLKLGLSSELYTLAQPRVGNDAYVKFINANLPHRLRFVHRRDLVPHIPLPLMGFRHFGPEIWQDLNDNYRICMDGESKECSNSITLRDTRDHCGSYLDIKVCHCKWEQVEPRPSEYTGLMKVQWQDLKVASWIIVGASVAAVTLLKYVSSAQTMSTANSYSPL